MNANIEIITTGEEVLSGQIVDTNASWLSAKLAENGFSVSRRTTVGDRMIDLVGIFRERSLVADAVIVNGGLGPTVDDLSAEAAALALDEPLESHQAWVTEMERKFKRMQRAMSPRNLKQALLPRSATIIDNPIGTACGFSIELNGTVFYFTPGVPSEFKMMVRDQILPDLKRRFGLTGLHLLKRLHCFGIAESRLDSILQPIELPAGIQLGFRAHLPTIEIKIMAHGGDRAAVEGHMAAVADAVRGIVGANIISEDDDDLARHVQKLMIARGFRLALAESCTGGMIASDLVAVPDSSHYFERGFVTYSNEAKTELLGVAPELIERHGAVSLEVARAMVIGAARAAGTSHALAVTGVAGPGGGSPEKPVGTVAFGLVAEGEYFACMCKLPGWGRTRIRQISTAVALDMLRRHLLALPVFGNYDYGAPLATDDGPLPMDVEVQ
jgi:nicotinamide-nucleotide amidase